MKKRFLSLIIVATMALSFVACKDTKADTAVEDSQVAEESQTADEAVVEDSEAEATESEETTATLDLADGVYDAEFTTDSGMFHVNEAYNNIGKLTVENGVGTIHITLVSKNIVNLYVGMAADAENDTENALQPTTDTVTYEDGLTEEVYGFDVPVSAIDEEFDLALLGTKGTWYDHKVKVSNPQLVEE
ncbi:MAG: hypothetical protein K6E79_02265 [Pseudobutyrivibrio sp.]|nr:hypothetical protein [Pseudobutyrivibrio sp.]